MSVSVRLSNGTEDDFLQQNKDIVERVVAEGIDITWVTYDGMDHGFSLYESRRTPVRR